MAQSLHVISQSSRECGGREGLIIPILQKKTRHGKHQEFAQDHQLMDREPHQLSLILAPSPSFLYDLLEMSFLPPNSSSLCFPEESPCTHSKGAGPAVIFDVTNWDEVRGFLQER